MALDYKIQTKTVYRIRTTKYKTGLQNRLQTERKYETDYKIQMKTVYIKMVAFSEYNGCANIE